MVENTICGMKQSLIRLSPKSSVGVEPSSPGASAVSKSISAARPSSQRRCESGPSTSTRSQVTLPASTWARIFATASFELSSQVKLVPVNSA